MKIYHYTSIQNLALILHSRNIRFNRLDKVDDMEEAAYGSGPDKIRLGQYYFVSCWTKSDEENLALWDMYTRYKGVRIGMESIPFITYQINEKYSSLINCLEGYGEDFYISCISNPAKLYDIKYVKNPEEEIAKLIDDFGTGVKISTYDVGTFKREEWSFQHESRFILSVSPIDMDIARRLIKPEDYKVNKIMKVQSTILPSLKNNKPVNIPYIDRPLDPEKLTNIEIMLGPMTSPADEIIVRALLRDFPNATIIFSKFWDKLRNHS